MTHARHGLVAAAAAFACAATGGATARGQVAQYWDVNGTTAGAGGAAPAGTWSTVVTNWNTDPTGAAGGAVGPWTDGNDAVFSAGTDASGAFTVTIDGTVTANSLTQSLGTVTVTGGTLALAAGASRTVAVTANTLTLASALTAANGLTKTGTGGLTLSGGNAGYAGDTLVTAGTLTLANAAAVGAASNIIVSSTTGGAGLTGTRVALAGGITTPAGVSLSLPSNATGDVRSNLYTTAGTNTFAGPVALSGTTGTVAFGAENAAVLNVTGPVTAAAGFNGNLILRGTGGTGTASGTVALGAGGLQKTDGGTWTLSGASNAWAGQTLVANGTLILGSAGALPGGVGATGGASNLNLNAAGAVLGLGASDFGRPVGTTADAVQVTVAGASFAAFGADRTVNFGGAAAPVAVGVAPLLGLSLGATAATNTVTVQNPINLGAAARTVNVNNGAAAVDGRLAGGFANPVASGTAVTVTGAGTLALAGDSSAGLTAAQTVAVGTGQSATVVRVESSAALGAATLTTDSGGNGSTARIELAGVSLSNPVTLYGRNNTSVAVQSVAGTNVLAGPISVTSGGSGYLIQADVGSTLSLTGASAAAAGVALRSLAGSRTVTLQGAGDGSIAGVVQNGTAAGTVVGLAKAGAGTWLLSAANTYTGGTSVAGGTLASTVAGGLGAGGVTVTAGTLRLDDPASIADAAAVSVAAGGLVNLNFPSAAAEVVSTLSLGGTLVPPGVYNAANAPAFLTGTGNLQVLVPEPGTAGLAAAAVAGLLARRRRKAGRHR